jgi:hypothetical protein
MDERTIVPILSKFRHFSMLLQFILKPYKKNNTKNWVTPEIINMSVELKNVHWLYKNTGDDNIRLYYNNLAKAYQHTLKKAKHKYTENRLAHTISITSLKHLGIL